MKFSFMIAYIAVVYFAKPCSAIQCVVCSKGVCTGTCHAEWCYTNKCDNGDISKGCKPTDQASIDSLKCPVGQTHKSECSIVLGDMCNHKGEPYPTPSPPIQCVVCSKGVCTGTCHAEWCYTNKCDNGDISKGCKPTDQASIDSLKCPVGQTHKSECSIVLGDMCNHEGEPYPPPSPKTIRCIMCNNGICSGTCTGEWCYTLPCKNGDISKGCQPDEASVDSLTCPPGPKGHKEICSIAIGDMCNNRENDTYPGMPQTTTEKPTTKPPPLTQKPQTPVVVHTTVAVIETTPEEGGAHGETTLPTTVGPDSLAEKNQFDKTLIILGYGLYMFVT